MLTELRTDQKDHVRLHVFDQNLQEDRTEVNKFLSAIYLLIVDAIDIKVSDFVKADHLGNKLYPANFGREFRFDSANISLI